MLRKSYLLWLMLSLCIMGCVAYAHVEDGEVLIPPLASVAVHDPSIIKVGDSYYIFGSHLAAAKSENLRDWRLIASGVREGNRLIPNVLTELKETLTWAQTNTLWAPDVVQLEDGRYYMYYCACKGDSPRSALGIAVSDNIEGPYHNLGIILKSGMWGTSEDKTAYDATRHPNTVDPHAFYDKEGRLWMVYGSYSGGIFILELNRETGFPLPEQGYGIKLTGGNHSRIEGPYILYNQTTDYYYLFLSFGGLDVDGGYNIRVARSKTPQGPYFDALGQEMIEARGPAGSFFDDRSIEPYGVKLIGNFLFRSDHGSYGYMSPGHNSAYYDPVSKKYFIIFHTRFPRTGEYHEVRVHQIFFNEDGWPVMTPLPYGGETVQKVSVSDVVGKYQYLNHDKDITKNRKTPVEIELNREGKITGGVTGAWQLQEDYLLELTIDELGGLKFKGFFICQWDPLIKAYVMTFCALSEAGITIWGKKS